MKTRTRTDFIVVHGAYTPPSMDIGAEEIRGWHVNERGFLDIGYHLVIRRDGTVEEGRNMDARGAHVKGYNHRSFGICLVGGKPEHLELYKGVPKAKQWEMNYTMNQLDSLDEQLIYLTKPSWTDNAIKYPSAKICGHRDFVGVNKLCPGFNVEAWWNDLH